MFSSPNADAWAEKGSFKNWKALVPSCARKTEKISSSSAVIKDFFNISFKIIAKDTVFLKYLVTFVAQKRRCAF